MTIKLRLRILSGDLKATLDWLKATGARLTGITRLSPNQSSDETWLYTVLIPVRLSLVQPLTLQHWHSRHAPGKRASHGR
jgi:hypothetical protein